jgi:hypothetical protein
MDTIGHCFFQPIKDRAALSAGKPEAGYIRLISSFLAPPVGMMSGKV